MLLKSDGYLTSFAPCMLPVQTPSTDGRAIAIELGVQARSGAILTCPGDSDCGSTSGDIRLPTPSAASLTATHDRVRHDRRGRMEPRKIGDAPTKRPVRQVHPRRRSRSRQYRRQQPAKSRYLEKGRLDLPVDHPQQKIGEWPLFWIRRWRFDRSQRKRATRRATGNAIHLDRLDPGAVAGAGDV